MSYLNVHYECIQNKQNMTISRWSCPFYLTLTAWRGDGMDEVNLLLPVASPSPPRVLQFALFTLVPVGPQHGCGIPDVFRTSCPGAAQSRLLAAFAFQVSLP